MPATLTARRTRAPTRKVRAEATHAGTTHKGKVVRAALNTVRIIQYLSERVSPCSLAQVARELQMVPSTCFHTLHTLAREKLVAYDPVRKEYVAGHGLIALARSPAIRRGDVSIIRPVLERVALEHDLTVSLWKPAAENRMSLLLAAYGPGSLRVHLNVGYTRPLYTGATGRIMAAYIKPTKRDLVRALKATEWARPPGMEQYLQQVVQARLRGWSVDERSLNRETVSIAVPVLNADGQFVMACAGTMLASRYTDDAAGRLIADLKAASREIGMASLTIWQE